MNNLLVARTKVTQGNYIVFLIDNQHRQRADDVKAGHHQNEGQEDIGNQFFNLHNLESVVLLLKTVFYNELGATQLLNLIFRLVEVAAWLQA